MSLFPAQPFALGLIFSFVSLSAMAASQDIFVKLDADKDGRLIKSELQVPCDREIFAALDRNGDSVIEPQEFKTSGEMASFDDKGGLNDKGIQVRWLEFRVGRFDLQDGTTITCNATEGHYPLEANASRADIELAKQVIQSRLAEDAMRYAKR